MGGEGHPEHGGGRQLEQGEAHEGHAGGGGGGGDGGGGEGGEGGGGHSVTTGGGGGGEGTGVQVSHFISSLDEDVIAVDEAKVKEIRSKAQAGSGIGIRYNIAIFGNW